MQPQGSYWYLDTRPDELAAMPKHGWEGRLRLAARALDQRLKADPLQTIIHGDAKAANMVFSADGAPVLYDFQYCGKAPPTKDVAYFLTCGSNVDNALESDLVAHYHSELSRELVARGTPAPTLGALMASLQVAACDLGRWMSGWGWWGHDLQVSCYRFACEWSG